MEQYELLWQYQQVDMELDQYEKEMLGNSNRLSLIHILSLANVKSSIV